MKRTESAIRRAIVILGGKVAAHTKIGVSFQTLHNWDQAGYVKDIAWALRVSKLSGIALIEFAEDAKRAMGRK